MKMFMIVLAACVLGASAVGEQTKVFRAGDRIAWIGDSITSNGHRRPWGYVNLLAKAAAATGTEGFDDIIGLGYGGWHVYGWHAYERASLKNPALPSRFDRVPTLGDVFTNRLDIIVIALGFNDNANPTFTDVGAWVSEYETFLCDLKNRCHPRQFVLCTLTPYTGDRRTPKNARLEEMNGRIRRLAAKHQAKVIDFREDCWELMDRVASLKTGYREWDDYIHPLVLGNAVMARAACRDLGESAMEAWMDREVARLLAELERKLVTGPAVVCKLRQDTSANRPGVARFAYEIPWNVVGLESVDSVRIKLPEGWSGTVGTLTPTTGIARVTGVPDRAANPVRVIAERGGRSFAETIEIPAPWLVSGSFVFTNFISHANVLTTNAVPPVKREDAPSWYVYTGTYDFAGGTDPSAVDIRALDVDSRYGARYVTRRVFMPRDMRVRVRIETSFWAASYGFWTRVDGRMVDCCRLVSSATHENQSHDFEFEVKAGWHDLEVLAAHREWDFYFNIRLLDPSTGSTPDGLRFALPSVP